MIYRNSILITNYKLRIMNYNVRNLLLVAVITLFFGCTEKQNFTISNPFDDDITGKAVVLSRDEVATYVTVEGTKIVLIEDNEGNVLTSQCDDIDGDGIWDELAFLISFKAGESKSLSFNAVDKSDAPEFSKRTNVRLGDKKPPYKEILNGTRLKTNESSSSSKAFQMEGPAWENDVVGFRNYFDARNGMDIYGKRTIEMVLDSVGLPGKQTYHELADWGMDVLKVGNSLGAGAIGMAIGDSLYRIGPSGEGHYRFICEGPVRAMFELTFSDVNINDRVYNISHQISIYAGDNFYRNKVTVEGLKGDENLITGIVDHDLPLNKSEYEGTLYFYTFGGQAYTHENLGMAVLVNMKSFNDLFSAPEEGDGITKTYVVSLNIENNKPVEYMFLAGWELQDNGLTNPDYFNNLIKKNIRKLSWNN